MTMTVSGSEFLSAEWHKSTINAGGVLASFYRRLFPRDTAKRVADALDCDLTTATNITKGHASERSITKAVKAHGWPLLMAMGEAMTGQSYADHLSALVQEHERARERAAARQDHLQALERRAAELVGLLGRSPSGGDGRALGDPRRPADGLGDRSPGALNTSSASAPPAASQDAIMPAGDRP